MNLKINIFLKKETDFFLTIKSKFITVLICIQSIVNIFKNDRLDYLINISWNCSCLNDVVFDNEMFRKGIFKNSLITDFSSEFAFIKFTNLGVFLSHC